MSWEIINPAGSVLTIAQLNREARTLWKTEGTNGFAQPLHEPGLENEHPLDIANWYDRVGGGIHNSETAGNWEEVKDKIIEPWLGLCLTEDIARKQPGVKPYLELIDHWDSKGYKPMYIKD